MIIPARNEEAHISAAVRQAFQRGVREVIVVDGESADRTAEIAASTGAKVLPGPANRGRQQNLGAEAASGEALLFLHADTRLPANFAQEIAAAFEDPACCAGAFTLRIDAPGRGLRLVEKVVDLRSRYLQLPYGDQAIFVRADCFREAGGFPDIPVMEDFELVRQLKRRGRIAIASGEAVTSARRWLGWGVWRSTWINQLTIAAYLLGVSPERLSHWRESISLRT